MSHVLSPHCILLFMWRSFWLFYKLSPSMYASVNGLLKLWNSQSKCKYTHWLWLTWKQYNQGPSYTAKSVMPCWMTHPRTEYNFAIFVQGQEGRSEVAQDFSTARIAAEMINPCECVLRVPHHLSPLPIKHELLCTTLFAIESLLCIAIPAHSTGIRFAELRLALRHMLSITSEVVLLTKCNFHLHRAIQS